MRLRIMVPLSESKHHVRDEVFVYAFSAEWCPEFRRNIPMRALDVIKSEEQ